MKQTPNREPIRDLYTDSEEADMSSVAGGKRRHRSHATYRLAVCSIFCAVGTVILCLGALIELMDIACAVLASILFLPIFYRYGTGYTLLCWAVTAVLSVMLTPQSLSPWMFLCLLGYYPVLKDRIDRLPKWAAFVVKCGIAVAAMGAYMFAFWLFMLQGSAGFADTFMLAFGDPAFGTYLAWFFIALCFVTFFAFDLFVGRVKIIYFYKWKKKADKWMK